MDSFKKVDIKYIVVYQIEMKLKD